MKRNPDYLLETVRTWQEMALELQWPARELEILEQLLISPHYVAYILSVKRQVIMVQRRSPLRLEGTGADGRRHTRTFVHVNAWPFRRAAVPESLQQDSVQGLEWCPIHGHACAKATEGCVPRGKKSVVGLELANIELRKTSRTFRPLTRRKTLPPLSRHSKKKKKDKRRILPGQLGLPDLSRTR